MQKKNRSNFLKKIFLIFILTLSLVLPFSFAPTHYVKAEESDPLQGTWVWNDTIDLSIIEQTRVVSINFISNLTNYTTLVCYFHSDTETRQLRYSPLTNGIVYSGSWRADAYKTIEINSLLSEVTISTGWGSVDEFFTWFQANATKQEEVVEPDIASGEYRVNYNYSWPLTETVEFTGGLTYNDVSYGSLFLGAGEIYVLSADETIGQKQIMDNYQWLVDSFTFTAPEGLYNTDDIHNAVESFNSQVNGTEESNLGLSLGDVYYTFIPNLSYNTLGYVEFNIPFKTGRDFEITYNYMYYSAVVDTLYYGGINEENIVYKDGSWTSTIYQNFYCDDLITNYAVGNFLIQNLDIHNIAKKYLIGGYYYFNSYLDRDDLAVINTLNSFSYVFKGNIYNGFEYEVVGVEPNPLYYYRSTIKYINSNTIGYDFLMDYSYTSVNEELTQFPTLAGQRQIYISPTYVNYETLTWLNENGIFMYVEEEPATLPELILVFPDVAATYLANVLSFEVFGINLFKAIGSLLAVSLAWYIIKKLL